MLQLLRLEASASGGGSMLQLLRLEAGKRIWRWQYDAVSMIATHLVVAAFLRLPPSPAHTPVQHIQPRTHIR
jgi:hypothetical protein